MDNNNNQHILRALQIADDLMAFANNPDLLSEAGSYGILSGVMRDCAYKIKRQVQREVRKVKNIWHGPVSEIKRQSFNPKNLMMILVMVLVLGVAASTPANAATILSTNLAETLGGLTFGDGGVVEYNATTDIASLYFDENLFSNNANYDGVYISTMPVPATTAFTVLSSSVLIRHSRA